MDLPSTERAIPPLGWGVRLGLQFTDWVWDLGLGPRVGLGL